MLFLDLDLQDSDISFDKLKIAKIDIKTLVFCFKNIVKLEDQIRVKNIILYEERVLRII